MVSRQIIFWVVDTQADFMLPGGKLYVPRAETLLPNLERLTNEARAGRVFLMSDACVHAPNDAEFQRFPPHCVHGTPGAAILPQTMATKFYVVPNRAKAKLPEDFSKVQQVILEKQTLDVFDNPHTTTVLERLKRFTDKDAKFVVFGVVTEYCVRLVAKGLLERGRRVALVEDAIATLDAPEGRKAIAELRGMGAALTDTDQALAWVEASLLSAGKRRGA